MVVPVDKVNGGDDKDGDKGMLKVGRYVRPSI